MRLLGSGFRLEMPVSWSRRAVACRGVRRSLLARLRGSDVGGLGRCLHVLDDGSVAGWVPRSSSWLGSVVGRGACSSSVILLFARWHSASLATSLALVSLRVAFNVDRRGVCSGTAVWAAGPGDWLGPAGGVLLPVTSSVLRLVAMVPSSPGLCREVSTYVALPVFMRSGCLGT